MRISAVICTHNRATFLSAAIESLLAQTLPATDYEILVIDNASTDETPQIIQGYIVASGNVTLRSARQPIVGLSHARNLAVQMAHGEIIAFMDDDAVADPEWLAALLDVYDTHPDAWAVGGKVLPLWDGERPAWLTDELLPHLSMLDLGEAVRPLRRGEELYGVNFSCRRCTFDEIGCFRSDLGRQGVALLGSEESDLQRRILQHGQALLYTPYAIVKHRVMAERLEQRYFVRLAYGKGCTRARLMITDSLQQSGIAQRIVRGGLGVLRQWFLLVLHPFDQTRQFYCLRTTARWLGFTQEVLDGWRRRHLSRLRRL